MTARPLCSRIKSGSRGTWTDSSSCTWTGPLFATSLGWWRWREPILMTLEDKGTVSMRYGNTGRYWGARAGPESGVAKGMLSQSM